MGWAARAKVRTGNPKSEVSNAGAVIGSGKMRASDGTRYRLQRGRKGVATGALLLDPRRVRGKAAVKAAKRRRVYVNGERVIRKTAA